MASEPKAHVGDGAPWQVYLALAIAMTTVGASAVLGKRLAAEIPVGIGSALRFGIATLLFAPLLLLAGGPPRLGRGDLGLLALQSFFGVFGFALFWLHGLRLTGAAAAGIVASTTPAVVGLVSWLLLRDRLGRRQILGIALAMGGVAAITLAGPGGAAGPNPLLGNLLVLGAVVGEALFFALGKKSGARLPPLTIAAAVTAIAFALFLPLALVEARGFDPGAVSGGAWAAVALYAVGPTVIGYSLAYRALAVLPTTTVGLFGAIVPVVAVLLAAALLGEPVGLAHGLGIAGVLSALILDVRGGQRRRARFEREHSAAAPRSASATPDPRPSGKPNPAARAG